MQQTEYDTLNNVLQGWRNRGIIPSITAEGKFNLSPAKKLNDDERLFAQTHKDGFIAILMGIKPEPAAPQDSNGASSEQTAVAEALASDLQPQGEALSPANGASGTHPELAATPPSADLVGGAVIRLNAIANQLNVHQGVASTIKAEAESALSHWVEVNNLLILIFEIIVDDLQDLANKAEVNPGKCHGFGLAQQWIAQSQYNAKFHLEPVTAELKKIVEESDSLTSATNLSHEMLGGVCRELADASTANQEKPNKE